MTLSGVFAYPRKPGALNWPARRSPLAACIPEKRRMTSMLKSVLQCIRYSICFALFTFWPRAGFVQTPAARQGPGAPGGPATGQIHGITRGGDRQPVPEVRVLVHSASGFHDRTVTSDGEGAFSVLDLSAGVYERPPSKVGFDEAPSAVSGKIRRGGLRGPQDARAPGAFSIQTSRTFCALLRGPTSRRRIAPPLFASYSLNAK